MITSLFFNLSFDLGGISLILFVIWFFVNFNNSAAAFKWFSLSILALLASVIILSYGATKLSRVRNSLPTQNQTEITNLKQEVASLKGNRGNSTSAGSHAKSDKKGTAEVPDRVVNSRDNQLVKNAVEKHSHKIILIAKVTNPKQPILARGVHSSQLYSIKGHHNDLKTGEFVIVKGTATSVEGDTINVTATSVKRQPGS